MEPQANITAPQQPTGGALALSQISDSNMPAAMAVIFDDGLFARCQAVAASMARAAGFMPSHLIGKPDACFAVVVNAITWKMNPYQVAHATYQITSGAKVGYEGKLCQAILERSGYIEGGIKFEYYGAWEKVQGNFIMKESARKDENDRPKKYASPSWGAADEKGVGIRITAQIKGEDAPRVFNFDLVQAQPRNSTLWATDPKTQLQYLAIRRFASTACPAAIFGIPFEVDDQDGKIIDVTPEKPAEGDFLDKFEKSNKKPRAGKKAAAPEAEEAQQPETTPEPVAPQADAAVSTPAVSRTGDDGREYPLAPSQASKPKEPAKEGTSAYWKDKAAALIKTLEEAFPTDRRKALDAAYSKEDFEQLVQALNNAGHGTLVSRIYKLAQF